MCGIVGLVKKKNLINSDIRAIKKLSNELSHRGPDEKGKYQKNNILLMMRRLSIVGLKNGSQPFFSNDKKIITVVNGEIYNHKELKIKLIKNKIKLKTKSDCEVIIGLYQLYGISFVEHLRGMFAISLFDQDKKKLFLIRDRMGEKPIYYSNNTNFFVFSSELRNILKYPGIKKKLDNDAINQFFHFGYIIEPKTPFKSIKKVEAGTIVQLNTTNLKIKKKIYWSISKIKKKYKKTNIEKIYSKLENACNYVTESDTRIALANSWGADSGLIYQNLKKENKKFSSIFLNKNKQSFQKKKNIKNIDYFEKKVSKNELINNFIEVVKSKDEPIADISSSNYFELLKFTNSKKIKVILFGHGGDELFWGYDWYNQSAKITHLLNSNRLLAFFYIWLCQIKKINNLKKIAKSPIDIFGLITAIRLFRNTKKNFSKRLFLTYENNHEYQLFNEIRKNFFTKKFSSNIRYNNPCDELYKKYKNIKNIRVFMLNFILKTYMLSNGIVQNDRISMFHSVELRLPYMDYKVVEEVVRHEAQNNSLAFSKNLFTDLLFHKKIIKNKNYKKEGFLTPSDWTTIIFNNFNHLLKDSILIKLGVMNKKFIKFSPIKLKIIILEIWLRDVLKK